MNYDRGDFSFEVNEIVTFLASCAIGGTVAFHVATHFTDHWYTGIPLGCVVAAICIFLTFYIAILPIYAMGAVIDCARFARSTRNDLYSLYHLSRIESELQDIAILLGKEPPPERDVDAELVKLLEDLK